VLVFALGSRWALGLVRTQRRRGERVLKLLIFYTAPRLRFREANDGAVFVFTLGSPWALGLVRTQRRRGERVLKSAIADTAPLPLGAKTTGPCSFSRWARLGPCASFGPSEEEERELVIINTVKPCLSSAGPKDLNSHVVRSLSPALGEKTHHEHLCLSRLNLSRACSLHCVR
jgi:hypothetical protein